MGHVEDSEIVQAVHRMRQALWHAQFVANFETGRAVKALLAGGHSQREVAHLLGMSKSKVNRYGNQADGYAVSVDHDPGISDAMEKRMWGPGDLRVRVDTVLRDRSAGQRGRLLPHPDPEPRDCAGGVCGGCERCKSAHEELGELTAGITEAEYADLRVHGADTAERVQVARRLAHAVLHRLHPREPRTAAVVDFAMGPVLADVPGAYAIATDTVHQIGDSQRQLPLRTARSRGVYLDPERA